MYKIFMLVFRLYRENRLMREALEAQADAARADIARPHGASGLMDWIKADARARQLREKALAWTEPGGRWI